MNRLLAAAQKHGNLRLHCWCAPKRCHAETIKACLETKLTDGIRLQSNRQPFLYFHLKPPS
ncbi:DUF4326 domain-containing protein [Termitidicoccus mucosus]|uniref:DUF4326 domain-containing protein n=1 Tax=Termitidicoccus mucosus TaxID=1184151 RepID=UPI000838AB97